MLTNLNLKSDKRTPIQHCTLQQYDEVQYLLLSAPHPSLGHGQRRWRRWNMVLDFPRFGICFWRGGYRCGPYGYRQIRMKIEAVTGHWMKHHLEATVSSLQQLQAAVSTSPVVLCSALSSRPDCLSQEKYMQANKE